MSRDREALLSRFRAVLAGRVRAGEDALGTLGSEQAAEVLRRELHTLKGESRMLGLAQLSALAHALEEHLPSLSSGDPASRDAARETMRLVLHRVGMVLDADSPADESEARVADELERLAVPMAEVAMREGAPVVPASGRPEEGPVVAPPLRRWRQVEGRVIDRLCEQLTELAGDLVELKAFASGSAASRVERLTQLEHWVRVRRSLQACTESAWALRLVPVLPTLQELGRHAARVAEKLGKDVEIEITAAGVDLETDVLDQMWDPLLHLVQNAVDHGLETPGERGGKQRRGRLYMSAESVGPNVVFTVGDDGRGLDLERVRRAAIERGVVDATTAEGATAADLREMIFLPGLSTKAISDLLSGRGVGLDVVKSKVEALGGSVRVDSTTDSGTRFTLTVPFAMTRERVLVVAAGDLLCGLPSRSVRAVVALPKKAPAGGPATVAHEGESFPLRSLSSALGVSAGEVESTAILLQIAGRTWAVAVPRIVGEEDLVRSPLEPLVVATSPFAASARTDSGALVLLLQPDRFARLLRGEARERWGTAPERRRTVLLVDDSPLVCDVVSEILVSQGLDVRVAHDVAGALATLSGTRVDLIVSDVEMPERDGFELLAEVRGRFRELPVVMLTTRGSIEDRKRAVKLGASAYIVKSDFRSGALVDTLQRFLDTEA